MKKLEFSKININLKPDLFKKYDYNINDVIGVKGEDRFILYVKNKLIRIYRGPLKSKALLSTYIPIEHAIFYSFEIEKSIIEKVDLDHFIETKVYEEAGVDETEKYIIKYKIIDSMKDEKIVTIEIIIVPVGYIENGYKDILKETGYIDYISFPAFAYKALYEEQIIKKANDLFVVFLYDKVFLTFYNEGELLSIVTISGGLNKVYESLSKLKIKDFDLSMFEKLLTKKGINAIKYTNHEKAVLDVIQDEFLSLVDIVNSQIDKISSKYNISEIDRIYVISEYGNIEGLQNYIQKIIGIDTFGFEFYEEYNLDRLAVNPFLFLGMLEAHNAYKKENQDYNFSMALRKPTFLYRPSGKLFSVVCASSVLMSIYPLYLYINGMSYESKNRRLISQVRNLNQINRKLGEQIKTLKQEARALIKETEKYAKSISFTKNFIKSVYEFKYAYIPKSSELVDITLLMNKNDVYLESMDYNNSAFSFNVFSFKDTQIPNFIDDLVKKGFNVETDGVTLKKGKYNATVRIKE
ncbi:hypothetical protein [Nautilia sp.]